VTAGRPAKARRTTWTGSQTVVGKSDNTFDYTLKDGTLAANYDIEKVLGELEVTALTDKVTVTITENSRHRAVRRC